MKPALRKWLSSLFIIATLAVVVLIAFRNNDLENTWEILTTLDPRWLAGAFGCWAAYILFDAASYYLFLNGQGNRISFMYAVFVSIVGFYYGNITPSASGGQPMQVYYMSKRDIPVGIGTSAISIRFLCNEFAIVLVAVVLWVCNAEFIQRQLSGTIFLAVIGLVINFAAVPLVLLAALHRPFVQNILNWGISVGTRLHFIRDPESTTLRVNSTIDTYHSSILRISKRPLQILLQVFFSVLSNLGLMGTVVFVYYAFGERGTPWYQLLTVSFMLYSTASYTPLPGASGAQEGGFLYYFRGLFSESNIGPALLIWRFVSYYLMILVGALVTIIAQFKKKKKKQA